MSTAHIRRTRRHAMRALLLAGLALLLVAPVISGVAAQEAAPRVVVGQIDGTITPAMAGYVGRVIKEAERDGAAVVVFELDTPGGLMSAMDDIVRDFLESDVPVVVYVAPRGARAASAGVFITYAAHVAAMAPATRIGSASPVLTGGGDDSGMSETMTRKVTNDAVSQIKNLAQLRDRNAEWAEQAVREAVNVTADEALALDVIDLMAPDLTTLLEEIDGRTVETAAGPVTIRSAGAEISNRGMGLFDQFFQLISDPTIAYLLISLGLIGIYVELSSPGFAVPGIVGTIAVLLGFFGLGTISINWAGVLLMVLALILFAADIYLPSLGMLTVGGVIAFVLGSYLLVGDEAPPGYEINPLVIWTVTACLVAFSLFLAGMVLKARLRPPRTGREMLIDAIGVVRAPLRPEGLVMVAGELWEATLAPGAASVEAGDRVVVRGIDGLRLTVAPASEADLSRAAHAEADRRRVIPIAAIRRQTEPQVTGSRT